MGRRFKAPLLKKGDEVDLISILSKEDIKELVSKNWLTHDAMWYGNCMYELGPEQANQLNKSAVRLMAAIEIKRIMKLMGKSKNITVQSFDELADIIETAFQVVQTNFMKFDFSFQKKTCCMGNSMSVLRMTV
jgi:hypothetical protein